MNFLKETLKELAYNGKLPSDVLWVGTTNEYMTWGHFFSIADFEYNSGFGINIISLNLVIVGENWWLERSEYDGSEGWSFKMLPKKPNDATLSWKLIIDKYSHDEMYKELWNLKNL